MLPAVLPARTAGPDGVAGPGPGAVSGGVRPSAGQTEAMARIRDTPPAELSPYLLQHVDNPVDWYPWGPEAFEQARSLDRPVFLSIGYSACHWCHVMAHESFEDPRIAALLNDSFVSIKVDREERPDVDAVYMEAVQALTGSGGWPMSVFLMPDGRPFFGGTYFPPDDRRGTPSFSTVLEALGDVWDNRRHEVEEQAAELSTAIASRSVIPASPDAVSLLGAVGGAGSTGPDLLGPAVAELGQRFDPEWGGFGPAPKFPQPTLVDLALRVARRHRAGPGGDSRPGGDGGPDRDDGGPGAVALEMAGRTLDAMAAGGIHDHLGGGFARYSTDSRWLVPHFEKMLYDQAGLLRAYLHGWQVTGRSEYLSVMQGIVGYVATELAGPSGGIRSAEDADSEGVEGRFYVWTPAQIAEAVDAGIDPRDGAAADVVVSEVSAWFGVTEGGNFEGSTILHRPVGEPLRGSEAVEAGRSLLFEARSGRVRPGLDDKVLTEWNAMYASALAEAAEATSNPTWSDAAVAIGEFLVANLRRADGRWLRSWREEGGARHLAYAADYAWLVDSFTRLAELTGRAVWTEHAVEVADGLLALFHDDGAGGFFTTGHDAEPLIVRTKEIFDGATPSANAVAALALARLGALTGSERYSEAAREVIDMFGDILVRHPTAFAHTLLTADLMRRGFTEVVVTGDRPDLLSVVRGRWLPGAVVAWGEPTGSPLWEGRAGDRAHVCRNYACRLPADDADTLSAQLTEELTEDRR